jgi:AcrR family transcriptional regulator
MNNRVILSSVPRAFREDERSHIEARLLETGRALFERQGLRKTDVASLARAAGIGKGSFYLFFPTKEALFLAISDRFELELKRALVRELDRLRYSGASAQALLRRYFELHFEAFERHPFLALLTDPTEVEALVRKVGPERFAAERENDALFFAELIVRWQAEGLVDREVDARAAAALSRAILALIQGRALIGDDDWGAMVELLIDALAERLAAD